MTGQRTLPLERKDRFELIRLAEFPRDYVFRGRGVRNWAPLCRLIEQLELCSGVGREVDGVVYTSQVRVEVLASKMRTAQSTTRHWLALAESLHLISVCRKPTAGGQGPNLYRIEWANLAALSRSGSTQEGGCVARAAPSEVRRAPSEVDSAPSEVRRANNKEVGPRIGPISNPQECIAPPKAPTDERRTCGDADFESGRRRRTETPPAGGWRYPIERRHLHSTVDIQDLYEQAVANGWVVDSDMNRVQFFALVAAVNRRDQEKAIDQPGAYLTTLLKLPGEGWKRKIRQVDEDKARKAVRKMLAGRPRP